MQLLRLSALIILSVSAIYAINLYFNPATEQGSEQPASQQTGSEQPSQDYYVVAQLHFPKIPDDLPENVRIADYIDGLNVDSVEFEPSDGSLYLSFSGQGLKAYPPGFFAVQERYAIGFKITAEGQNVDGALLFEVREILTDRSEFEARIDPMAKDPTKLQFTSTDGRFERKVEEGESGYSLSGGPIEQGWSQPMREKSLQLFKFFDSLFDCFIATAVYQNPYASQLTSLRAFRDRVLLQSEAGARLVRQYYRIGPVWARELARRPALRALLLPLISGFAQIADDLDAESPLVQAGIEWLDAQAGPWLERQDARLQLDPHSLGQIIQQRTEAQ